MLNLMPATPRGASIVDETATPLPRGGDEGALLDLKTVPGEPLLLHEAVAAIEATYVEEHDLPGCGRKTHRPSGSCRGSQAKRCHPADLDALCQHEGTT